MPRPELPPPTETKQELINWLIADNEAKILELQDEIYRLEQANEILKE